MAAPKKVDYASIEPDWRAGIKSIDQLCTEYFQRTGVKVTKGSLLKYFKKEKIPRDQKARILAKAEAMVTEREAKVTMKEEALVTMTQKQRNAAVQEANAQSIADVIMASRANVRSATDIVVHLLREQAALNEHQPELHMLGELMKDPAENVDKLNEIYCKIISWGGRVDGINKLTTALERVINLQREIHGIKASDGDGNKRHESIAIRLVPAKPRTEEEE